MFKLNLTFSKSGYMWIEYGCNNIGRGASYIVVGK